MDHPTDDELCSFANTSFREQPLKHVPLHEVTNQNRGNKYNCRSENSAQRNVFFSETKQWPMKRLDKTKTEYVVDVIDGLFEHEILSNCMGEQEMIDARSTLGSKPELRNKILFYRRKRLSGALGD